VFLLLQGMRSGLEAAFGPAQPPSEAQVAAAVKEIVAADIQQQQAAAAAAAEAAVPTASPVETVPAAAASAAGERSTAPAGRGLLLVRGGRAGLRAAAAALSQLD
jgi:hypothetical protein